MNGALLSRSAVPSPDLAQNKKKRPSEQAREQEEKYEGDEENWERENDLAQIRKAVCKEINLPHPLEYEGDNLHKATYISAISALLLRCSCSEKE